jgi:hypothetical protein
LDDGGGRVKVDKNQMIGDQVERTGLDSEGVTHFNYRGDHGIPLRLEIASRLMAGAVAGLTSQGDKINMPGWANTMLYIADELIKAHNESREDDV